MAISSPDVVDIVDIVDDGTRRCLVWRFERPVRAISSSVVGGGVRDDVAWVINMTVRRDYSRLDPADHLVDVAAGLGLHGTGVGMMTAVDVGRWSGGSSAGAVAAATVGVRIPTWAADPDAARMDPHRVGTINIVTWCPARLGPAALVNAVGTVTEAKVQALMDEGIAGTGTASDAVCVLCPVDGDEELFGGPRSTWGSRLAIATHAAVRGGIRAQRTSPEVA